MEEVSALLQLEEVTLASFFRWSQIFAQRLSIRRRLWRMSCGIRQKRIMGLGFASYPSSPEVRSQLS